MKAVICKARKTQPFLSSKIILNSIEINEDKRIANEFNNFFIDIGPELAKEIPRPTRFFKSYVPKVNSTTPTGPINARCPWSLEKLEKREKVLFIKFGLEILENIRTV